MKKIVPLLLCLSTFTSLQAAGCIDEKNTTKEFLATNSKSFDQLMTDSIAIMHKEMSERELLKNPDKKFLEMMVAHHQGAVNMALSVLLYSKNKEVRALAQNIVATQQGEIQLMKLLTKETP